MIFQVQTKIYNKEEDQVSLNLLKCVLLLLIKTGQLD